MNNDDITNALALKEKQEFAAKEKAKNTAQSATKAEKKATHIPPPQHTK